MKTIAVDLGMGSDVTSLVVIEGKSWEYLGTRELRSSDWIDYQPFFRDPVSGKEVTSCPPPEFHLRYLERLPAGASYPEIVRKVKALKTELRDPLIAIDATGVGNATLELFRQAEMSPYIVTITAGDEVVQDGSHYRVPKRDVISAAQVMLQTGRLKIARDLLHGALLIRELQNFRMNVDLRKTQDALSWREGTNDDLVLALAVGLWIGEKHNGIPSGMSVGRPAVYATEFWDGDREIDVW